MTTVLLVEDDRNLGDSLAAYLTAQGFAVRLARTLADARCEMDPRPAIVVLDWMLPDGQGLDLLTELRTSGSAVPVIFLTARGDLVDRVVGLEAGAGDYVVKPFEPRELVARIRAQLRAGAAPAAPAALRVAGVVLDPGTCQVQHDGRPVELSPKEFLLLKLLMESPERVFSREEVLTRVWGYEHVPSTRTVDTHVLQLRQKLAGLRIETVRGFGYRLRAGDGEGA